MNDEFETHDNTARNVIVVVLVLILLVGAGWSAIHYGHFHLLKKSPVPTIANGNHPSVVTQPQSQSQKSSTPNSSSSNQPSTNSQTPKSTTPATTPASPQASPGTPSTTPLTTPSTTSPSTSTPPPPTNLTNTGPANELSLFITVSVLGFITHTLYMRMKNSDSAS